MVSDMCKCRRKELLRGRTVGIGESRDPGITCPCGLYGRLLDLDHIDQVTTEGMQLVSGAQMDSA